MADWRERSPFSFLGVQAASLHEGFRRVPSPVMKFSGSEK